MIILKIHYHSTLASYFASKPLYLDESTQKKPNTRKLVEQPWQQTKGEMWDEVTNTLCNLDFIQAKAAAKMTYKLIDDFNEFLNFIPDNQENFRKQNELQARLDKYARDLVLFAEDEDFDLEIPESIMPPRDEKLNTEIELINNSLTRLDKVNNFYQFIGKEAGNLQKYAQISVGFAIQQAWNYNIKGFVNFKAKESVNNFSTSILLLKCAGCNQNEHSFPMRLKILEKHNNAITSLSITPDGHIAITASKKEMQTCIWDLNKGECLFALKFLTYATSITADGKKGITTSQTPDGVICLFVWDLEKGECNCTINSPGDLENIFITADGSRAMTGGADAAIHIWDLNTNLLDSVIETQHRFNCMSITPDGKIAMLACYGTIEVWDLDLGIKIHELAGHKGIINSVSITPDGYTAISGGNDGKVLLWDLRKGICLKTLVSHEDPVFGVIITPDGKIAISGGGDFAIAGCRDYNLRIWNLQNGECIKMLRGHADTVFAVNILPNGMKAISSGADRTIVVWDVTNGLQSTSCNKHNGIVSDLCCTSDLKKIISGGADRAIRLWNTSNGEYLNIIECHERAVTSLCIMPDNSRVVSGSVDKSILISDIESYSLISSLSLYRETFAHEYGVKKVCVSPDGSTIISGGDSGEIRIWRIPILYQMPNRNIPLELKGHVSGVGAIVTTPDGKRIISGGEDYCLRIWDIQEGKCLNKMVGHSGSITGIAVTPDGRIAISCGGYQDMKIRIWDIINGVCLRVLEGHTNILTGLIITADGKTLLSISADMTLRLWNINQGILMATCKLESAVTSVCLVGATGYIACGTEAGDVVYLNLYNLIIKPPLITALRLYKYNSGSYDGEWDEAITAVCPRCGLRFAPPASVLETIEEITKKAGLRPEQSPCLELPDEAWEEPGLLDNCPNCGEALKFNPFIAGGE